MVTLINNEDIICHPETSESESDQKKQTSCTTIRLEYKIAGKKTIIPRFLQESMTLDITNKLSVDKFRKLGLVKRSNFFETKKEMAVVVHRKLLEKVI